MGLGRMFQKFQMERRLATLRYNFEDARRRFGSDEPAMVYLLANTVGVGRECAKAVEGIARHLETPNRLIPLLAAVKAVGFTDKLAFVLGIDSSEHSDGLLTCANLFVSASASQVHACKDKLQLAYAACFAGAASLIAPGYPPSWLVLHDLATLHIRLDWDKRDHLQEGIRYCTSYLSSGRCPDEVRNQFEEGLKSMKVTAGRPIGSPDEKSADISSRDNFADHPAKVQLEQPERSEGNAETDSRANGLVFMDPDTRACGFASVGANGRLNLSPPELFRKMSVIVLLNAKREVAGFVKVIQNSKVRLPATLQPNNDLLTMCMVMIASLARDLPDRHRVVFSNWGGLSEFEWTVEHRQLFVFAYLARLQKKSREGGQLIDAEAKMASVVATALLPTLPRLLTGQVEEALASIFEKRE
jgi:hypothetical protein